MDLEAACGPGSFGSYLSDLHYATLRSENGSAISLLFCS